MRSRPRAARPWGKEAELLLDVLASLGGDATGFGACFLFFEPGSAVGLIGEVPLAFEAARGEAGKAVEHTDEVGRIVFASGAEGIGANVSEGFADEGGGDFAWSLEAVDAVTVAEEIDSEFLAGAAGFDALLLLEPLLMAPIFPGGKVFLGKIFAPLAELLNNFGVGQAVFEHLIEVIANGFWKA